MFSCPGDFLFGDEYVDKVFLENGSQEKSDLWEGISFKCTGLAGTIKTRKTLCIHKQVFEECSHSHHAFPVGKQMFESCPLQKNSVLGTKM